MSFIPPPKKKKKYKYNNYEQVRKLSGEKFCKNIGDISPEILDKILIEDYKKFGHPDLDCVNRIKREKQKIK